MMKKRISSLAVMLVMLFALAIPAAAAPEGANTDVKIVVDGKDLTSQFNEDTLWMEDGITMAGVRALGEAVGADVRYDSATGSVVVEGLKQATGVYSPVADYEYLVGAAAWQMSAEAHALMMQAFNIAKENVDEMAAAADAAKDQTGYYWQMANGGKQLMYQGKRVAVVSDIDDTLVDGVHYTANILGRNGGGYLHIFGIAPPAEGQALAHGGLAVLAVVAVVAGGGIVARHPVPLLHMCHPGAHRGHHAGELVAVGVGRLEKRVAALEVFHIRAAGGGNFVAHEHLAGAGRGDGDLHDADIFHIVEHRLLHRTCHRLSSQLCPWPRRASWPGRKSASARGRRSSPPR